MATPYRCILLTGAPSSDQLDWSEDGLLTAFSIALRHPAPNVDGTTIQSESSIELPQWRSIVPIDLKRHTSDLHGVDRTAILPVEESSDRNAFVEHSMAFLEDIDASQLAPMPYASAGDTRAMTTTFASFYSDVTDTSLGSGTHTTATRSFPETTTMTTTGPVPVSITDLNQIPSAAHLHRIAPQTVTVDLLAGIITAAPPRRVRLRRRAADMDIVELLVGDDTRAGFGVTFWLSPDDGRPPLPPRAPEDSLRAAVCALRPSHVVLLRNVALSAYRARVYGQSLGGRLGRSGTTVAVIRRESGYPPSFAAKLRRVRDWADRFVGMRPADGGERSRGRTDEEFLPADTQDQ